MALSATEPPGADEDTAAAKDAEVAPGGIVTRGTTTLVELLETDTAAPVEGEGRLNPTVQYSDWPAATVVGLQTKFTNCGVVETIDNVAFFELPPYEPVTVTEWLTALIETAAEKTPETDPAGIFVDDGTVRLSELRDNPTTAPPVGAGAVSVTTQEVDPPAPIVVGLQVMLLTPGVV